MIIKDCKKTNIPSLQNKKCRQIKLHEFINLFTKSKFLYDYYYDVFITYYMIIKYIKCTFIINVLL